MELNKLRIALLSCFIFTLTGSSFAQTPSKYWVRFKDKNGSPYSVSTPTAYLSQKSIDRRVAQGIAIDITDIPVNQSYINQVNSTGAQVFQRSKWMNAAIVVVTNTVQLAAINSLTCVLGSQRVGKLIKTSDPTVYSVYDQQVHKASQNTAYNYGPSFTQNAQIGADCLHENGYRGQNMTIGVLDSGFDNVNNNDVFDSLRNEGRILGTRDIVAGNSSVYEDHDHGAMVLSCISGNTPGQLIGTGPKAQVYLIRTEDVYSEKPIEESNWIVGAEYADSVGVDIMTTSLGYTTFDSPYTSHVYSDLNGRTAPMSVAATMAARKGIFVLNAAGNDGNGSWNYIGIPADADSICTVGSVDGSGNHSGFSSVGPTADGRIKPDLSSMGQGSYVCSPSGSFFGGNGTSFATPILAGAVACLWQANPTRTNMEILNALKTTASRSSNPDNNFGWGIPNMCEAHNLLNGTSLGVSNPATSVQFKLYPNPAESELRFSSPKEVEEIFLGDVLGRLIPFNLQSLAKNEYKVVFAEEMVPGVYILSIKSDGGIINSKFIKE
jgi:subtilisin family serine protease